MNKIAEALAGNPELIESQMSVHLQTVAEMQGTIRRLEDKLGAANNEAQRYLLRAEFAEKRLAILNERLAADEALIEEVEVKRLSLLLGSLDEFCSVDFNCTLETLLEDGKHTALASILHAAMRGRNNDLRNRCTNCGDATHSVCYPPDADHWTRRSIELAADREVEL